MGNERQIDPGLRALVPELALELAARPAPTRETIDGSLVSADMSGFTALTERLSAKGKVGAEEITARVNGCFTALIDEATRAGGDVLKFGGDSMLMLVRGADHVRRAASAGLAMQRALRVSGPARRANLSMTVAVAAGPFDVFVVGDDTRDLMITGANVDTLTRLDGAATAGDVIVDERIARHLAAEMALQARGDGFTIHGDPREGSTPRRARSTAAPDRPRQPLTHGTTAAADPRAGQAPRFTRARASWPTTDVTLPTTTPSTK